MSATYSFGTNGVRVKVDEETGKVAILDYVAAHDVGRAINPLLLDGQVYGGVLMGVGYALTEQVVLRNGRMMNPDFRDYKILTAKDAVPLTPVVIETIDEDGPFGAKGIGKPGCVPTAPAIANAIYDAIGVSITDLPITPERVLAAIKKKRNLEFPQKSRPVRGRVVSLIPPPLFLWGGFLVRTCSRSPLFRQPGRSNENPVLRRCVVMH